MAKVRLLLTGGTGFLGQCVATLLREKYDVDLLSRGEKADLRGDLTMWNAGLEDLSGLKGRYRALVHLAGLYDLEAGKTDCYLNNVAATSVAMRLCRDLEIPVILNASSVAAGVNSKLPIVRPYDLNFNSTFPDAYSESKALAEQLIHNWVGEPALRVNLRLGVLVGDSREGRIARLDGPYHAAVAFDRIRGFIENFPGSFPFPGQEKTRLPLVPVDAAARAVRGFVDWSLTTEEKGYHSHHLVPEQGLPVREFYRSVLKHLFIPQQKVRLVERMPRVVVKKISKWAVQFPEEQLNYILSFPKYDSTSTMNILGRDWCPEFKDYERAFWSGYENHVSNR